MQNIAATMLQASTIVVQNPSAHPGTFAFNGLEPHLVPIITSVSIYDCEVFAFNLNIALASGSMYWNKG
jgi:hypothetical protein